MKMIAASERVFVSPRDKETRLRLIGLGIQVGVRLGIRRRLGFNVGGDRSGGGRLLVGGQLELVDLLKKKKKSRTKMEALLKMAAHETAAEANQERR